METIILTEEILAKEKERIIIEGRERSRSYRKTLINFFMQKKITLSEFVLELFDHYARRKQKNNSTVTVSFKLKAFQLTYIDMEIFTKQNFIDRSEFLRSAINDYISTHGDNGLKEILKMSGVPSLEHETP